MNRIALSFVFFLGFGSLGIHWAAAQEQPRANTGEQVALEHAKSGYPVPQALVPAQRPVLAQPPGYIPPASSATPSPQPQAGAKSAVVNPPARQMVPGTKGIGKEPEQMKIVALYRGQGFFDSGLAEKLRPVLAKAFDVTPATASKPGDVRSKAPDLLRSVFGQKQGAEKSADPNAVVKTDQP
jgi:hypothetical protein